MANDQDQRQGQDKAASGQSSGADKAKAATRPEPGRGDDQPRRPLEEVEQAPAHQARVQEALVNGPLGQAPTAAQVGIDVAADEQRTS